MDLSDSYKILQGIIHMLATSPDGVSTGEIVQTYQISRRLIPKYISILEDAGIPIYTEKKRYYLVDDYFNAFTLTSDESEFLYLILERSLILHSDRWHTLRSLLKKLSNKIVEPLSSALARRIDLDAPEQVSNTHFRLLAKAKREMREVWVEYYPLHRTQPSTWKIRPYRFISNLFSDGLYISCYGSRSGDGHYVPLSLRLNRITDVQLTDIRFSEVDLPPLENNLNQAWGVWHSEQEPTHVHLRFELRHYDRLIETIWHPSQQISVDREDQVHFTVDVSEPDEMVPWIRSWGAGVVILEPKNLRERIIHGLQRQLQAYGIASTAITEPDHLPEYLWAKYRKANGEYHQLIYHLLDVMAVAWQMWDEILSSSQQQWLAAILGCTPDAAKKQIAFLAGLHDIGKATPSFQCKAESLYQQLLAHGIKEEMTFDIAHGILSSVIMPPYLQNLGCPPEVAKKLALTIGGHHGTWISSREYRDARHAAGGNQWHNLQENIIERLLQVLEIDQVTLDDDEEISNIFIAFLSGFVSVCDWIGSDETYFPYQAQSIPDMDYFQVALQRAEDALHGTGWIGWKHSHVLREFESIFPFHPNAMQQAVMQACTIDESAPRLILIEYLTGGGKTEIALYLADLIINTFGLQGIYVAMPTQATSNQMFGRVSQYLQSRYPDQPVNIQLIHGQSEHQPEFRQIMRSSYSEGNESSLTSETWFQNRRRALLAPFAVGTVDQAMLAVLQTRHHFVRQYALSNKVVLFDEIHAYDTYMNEIIDRLLNWLTSLNSPLILLSATLSRQQRQNLLKQVGAQPDAQTAVAYPRLTIVDSQGDTHIHALPQPPSRSLKIENIAVDDVSAWLAPIYQQGGCIALVCNTVNEAMLTTHQLLSNPDINPDDVILFHARTLSAWRNEIEETVLGAFGKNGNRPARAIIVATQIIEQSLDLDFDLLVTRVAPIDLLIQRAGRLHRHARHRPKHLQNPALVIQSPRLDEHNIPDFGVDEAIYARYILLKTWEELQRRTSIVIPEDVELLVNAVYDTYDIDTGSNTAYEQSLKDAYLEMTLGNTGQAFRGSMHRIAHPTDEDLIGYASDNMPDDEYVSTRDIQQGIDIICLGEAARGVALPTLVQRVPTKDEIRTLLQYRVTIRSKQLVRELKGLPEHPDWRRIPQLAAARPLVFSQGLYLVPNTSITLRIDPFFGLEILEEVK